MPSTLGEPRPTTREKQVLAVLSLVLVVVIVLLLRGGDDAGDEPEAGRAGTEADLGPGPGEPLSWAPPALDDPTEVDVEPEGADVRLGDDEDAIVRLPDEPVTGTISIDGGRNIHLIGGEIAMDDFNTQALKLQHWRGTLHVEGLVIDPGGTAGHENDAIRVNSKHPESTAVFQNIWVEPVAGTRETSHGDIIQAWGGPARLRVDRLTGYTEYQGFFLALEQFDWAPDSLEITLRDIDLHGMEPGPASLYHPSNHNEGSGEASIVTPVADNLWGRVEGPKAAEFPRYVVGGSLLEAGTPDGVRNGWANGTAVESHFVDRATVGIGYRSPGYRS